MKDIAMIDVTWRAIFKVCAVIIFFYIMFLLHNVIVWTVLALMISVIFNPWIESVEKRGLPRSVAAATVYFSFLLVCGLLVFIIVPPLLAEMHVFSNNFIKYFDKVPALLSSIGLDSFQGVASLSTNLNESLLKLSSNVFNLFASVFGSIFAGITIFVLALFMSIEEKEVIKGLALIAPKGFEKEVLARWDRAQHHVVGWFGSRILCCICVAIMTFLVCVFLKIKFSLALALLAGITNMIPMVGPIVMGILLAAFALLDSWGKMVLIVLLFIGIQQVESNILSPILTKKLTGLPTMLVLFSLLVGGALGGIVGAILAIPLAGIFFEAARDYLNKKKA